MARRHPISVRQATQQRELVALPQFETFGNRSKPKCFTKKKKKKCPLLGVDETTLETVTTTHVSRTVPWYPYRVHTSLESCDTQGHNYRGTELIQNSTMLDFPGTPFPATASFSASNVVKRARKHSVRIYCPRIGAR